MLEPQNPTPRWGDSYGGLRVDYAALGSVASILSRVGQAVLGAPLEGSVANVAGRLVGAETAEAAQRLGEHLTAGVVAYVGRLEEAATVVTQCAAHYQRIDAALAASTSAGVGPGSC